jgi:hypothetical protein
MAKLKGNCVLAQSGGLPVFVRLEEHWLKPRTGRE